MAVMGWLQDHGWIAGLLVAAALVLAGLAWWSARRRSQATSVPGAAARRRVDMTFTAAVLVTLVVGLAVVLWLLEQADQLPAGKDQVTAQADAVKTGATIALGTGGAAYLLLAYRRQRLDEVDTRERRITELYTKAVEQLGHEKAPVRLGALYSLERLAQNNPEHRQTVIDVVCAYLRMPYTPPAEWERGTKHVNGEAVAIAGDHDPAPHSAPGQDPAQEELQVRQTAQRILASHLHVPSEISGAAAQRRRPSPRRPFWRGISLDLTGAVLINVDFGLLSVLNASFDRATFLGNTQFTNATFQSTAGFTYATFRGDVRFDRTYLSGAWFDQATFLGDAWFHGATLSGGFLHQATFHRTAGFTGATFQGIAFFDWAIFHRLARFDEAIFQDIAQFEWATFHGAAWFNQATFKSEAWFDKAKFEGEAWLNEMTFTRSNGGKGIVGARVLHLDDPNLRRAWPDGYTVRPDPADPTRGTLVHAEQTERPEPAVPPSDETGR